MAVLVDMSTGDVVNRPVMFKVSRNAFPVPFSSCFIMDTTYAVCDIVSSFSSTIHTLTRVYTCMCMCTPTNTCTYTHVHVHIRIPT